MSIDGIGKRGGVTGASAPGAQPAQGSFEVGRAEAATPLAAAGSDAFLALERGELSVEQYLDARVEMAVAPLVSKLSPEQLEFVRGELRTSLETDPVLIELVQKTTGTAARTG
jgi:hypothetical protein